MSLIFDTFYSILQKKKKMNFIVKFPLNPKFHYIYRIFWKIIQKIWYRFFNNFWLIFRKKFFFLWYSLLNFKKNLFHGKISMNENFIIFIQFFRKLFKEFLYHFFIILVISQKFHSFFSCAQFWNSDLRYKYRKLSNICIFFNLKKKTLDFFVVYFF